MNNSKNNLNEKKPFSLREWLFGLSYDRKIFALGLVIAFFGLVFWLLFPLFKDLTGFDECVFKKTTGFYCPGCGCTRSVNALLSGHILISFLYNPFIPYCVIMWVLYTGSHILEILKVPRIKGMKYRDIYVYIALILIFSNWIVKNILLFIINF